MSANTMNPGLKSPWENAVAPVTTDDVSEPIYARFARHADSAPDQEILLAGDRSVSYAELDSEACRWANSFAARLPEGAVVAVLCANHLDRISAMLGATQSGHIFLILDPTHPRNRLIDLMRASGASLVACDDASATLAIEIATVCDAASIAAGQRDTGGRLELAPADPSRVFALAYTSGSTGKPKGVMLTCPRMLMNAVVDTLDAGIEPGDRFALLAPPSNYAYLYQVFTPLASGAIPSAFDTATLGIDGLASWITEANITHYRSVPTLFRRLMQAGNADRHYEHVESLGLGGEPIIRSDIDSFIARFSDQCRLTPYYGLTEVGRMLSSVLTCKDLEGFDGKVFYDLPSPGLEVLLTDDSGAAGQGAGQGELVAVGEYLSSGYWRQPELTTETFVPEDGAPGVFRVRTGDIFRRDQAGRYAYVGRRDHQFKIRGNRVDLAEVQALLADCPGVIECAVAARPDPAGDLALVAYLRCSDGIGPSKVRDALNARAPDYMRPRAYTEIESLPTNTGGKVDLKALPDPHWGSADGDYDAPTTDLEIRIAEIWQGLLRSAPLGRTDHFFDQGGDSMLGIEMLQQVERAQGTQLPLSVLYENPVLKDFAHLLEDPDANHARSLMAPIKDEGDGPILFFLNGRADLIGKHLPEGMRLYWLDHLQDDAQAEVVPIETLAARYIAAIRGLQPSGPYRLGGFCFGGNVAFEMARQLEACGEAVDLLLMLDTVNPRREDTDAKSAAESLDEIVTDRLHPGIAVRLYRAVHRRLQQLHIKLLLAMGRQLSPLLLRKRHFNLIRAASRGYRYAPYGGSAILVIPDESARKTAGRERAWDGLLGGGLRVVRLDGMESHLDLVREPGVVDVARLIQQELAEKSTGSDCRCATAAGNPAAAVSA
jgi:acyl-coenzyme A synthetase/AMP-(fatty) acid ligase/thioesterase domain-containing protein